jgi:predicted ArsR family transcriptional regulator
MSLKRGGNTPWIKALQIVLEKQTDDVPKDWLTSDQVGKQMNLNFGQASKFLAMMIKEGVVEKKKFRIVSKHGTGIVRPTEHYRLISSVKEIRQKVSASSKS